MTPNPSPTPRRLELRVEADLVDLPSIAADLPALAADLPSVAADLPSVAADLPAIAADLPVVAADLPSVAADLPTVAADLPSVAADLPIVAPARPAFGEIDLPVVALPSEATAPEPASIPDAPKRAEGVEESRAPTELVRPPRRVSWPLAALVVVAAVLSALMLAR